MSNGQRPRLRGAILGVLASVFLPLLSHGADGVTTLIDELRAAEQPAIAAHPILSLDILAPFYRKRNDALAWTDDRQRAEFVALLGRAGEHGMRPADFFYNTLMTRLANKDSDPAVLDLLLSEALARYAYNRVFGKVNPVTIDRDINFQRSFRRDAPPAESMAWLLDQPDLAAAIDGIAAHGPWYRSLQAMLRELQARQADGGWPVVPEGDTLHPGDRDPRVRALRDRLSKQPGSGRSTATDPDLFDEALAHDVKRFQRAHGIDVDGIVGKGTLATLNTPVERRIEQLALSLERLRWVSGDVEEHGDFIAVNIAGFRVHLVEDGEIRWTSRAMVGTPYRQTPVFRGKLAYLEFNPTWTVPPGIHRKDVLPAVKKNPSYLADKHMQVLTNAGDVVDPAGIDWQSYGSTAPYVFRQSPGPWNALGQVKFIFPNSHFVFLHDTPHRELFGHSSRAFSSGCIRVQDPMDLAERLLARKDDWDRARIDRTLEGGETTRVTVDGALPVYLLYLTAAVDTDGSIMFLDDIYDRDPRVLAALEAPMHIDLPSP